MEFMDLTLRDVMTKLKGSEKIKVAIAIAEAMYCCYVLSNIEGSSCITNCHRRLYIAT